MKARTDDQVGGAEGKLRVEELKNGAHLVIAERPGAQRVRVQIGVAAGGLQDPEGKLGAAHLLEHLAFEGSSKTTGDEQEKLRAELGGAWNAYTTADRVVYFGIAPAEQAQKAAGLITEMFREPSFESRDVKQEKAAVKNEMLYRSGGAADLTWNIEERLLFGDQPHTQLVIGTKKTVDAIEPKDLRALHRQYYTGRNTVALVEGPPDALPIDQIRRELEKLPAGARVTNADLGQGYVEGQALQLVPDPGNKAVDLSVSIPFAPQDLTSTRGLQPFMKQLNEVLNDRLRRIDHATYGVGADFVTLPEGDAAALNIRTTVPRAKAKAAVERIVSTLEDARDGFGPKRFESTKKRLLSEAAMTETKPRPTIAERAQKQFDELIADPAADGGADLLRLLGGRRQNRATAIEGIRYEDVTRVGESLINLENLKVLATGNVGDGREIRSGLREAGIETRSIAKNPVDLSVYRDMGLAVKSPERGT